MLFAYWYTVLWRAAYDTWDRVWPEYGLWALGVAVIALLLKAYKQGFPGLVDEWRDSLKHAVIAVLILLAVVFAWNLVRAPMLLQLEAVARTQQQTIHFVQKDVPSTNEDNPYAISVVVQAGQEFRNQKVMIICDGPVTFGNLLTGPGTAKGTILDEITIGSQRVFNVFVVEVPEFLPERTLKVVPYSVTQISVLRVELRP